MYHKSAHKLLKLHPTSNSYKEKEIEYHNKWAKLQGNPDKKVFRLFSQYIGPNPDIVPEDISSGIIQSILNPIVTRGYYQDKNMFEKILRRGFFRRP